MNAPKTLAVLLLVALLVTASFAVMSDESPSLAETRDSEPTMATCQAWIQENHSLDYDDHGCQEHTDILNAVASQGGGVIPVDDNRFSIIRFPENWEQMSDRTLVVTLHGSGGYAEPNYQWWTERTAGHQYAVVSLQYAQEDPAGGDLLFDDGAQIYENLRTTLSDLSAHCPLTDTAVALHGFSKGSARVVELALMDRAPDGMKTFASFVADSGTGFAETGGEIPSYLQNAPPGALSGAHFWLYCGELDHGGQTCTDMDRLAPIIHDLGGTVDALYKNLSGGHGIFTTPPEHSPTAAQLALFDYLDALEPLSSGFRSFLPFVVSNQTSTPTPTPSPDHYEPPAGCLVISYNANYLRGSPDYVQQATSLRLRQFVPTLNRHLDLIDGLDMAADYYFSGLAAEKLAEWSTQTVTRLLESSHGLHYHGANRPPYPQLVDQVLGQDWEQDVATVRTYETDGLNPATGAHVGGITAFRNVFGQDPFATGRFFEASILAVDKEMGVKMAVGLEDNTGASRNDAWFMGVLNRSESLALGPSLLVDAALNDQSEEYLAQVEAQLTSLTDPVPIVALLAHDHDFYKYGPADQEKIWALYEQVLELTQELGFRSVTLHDIYALAENGPAPTLTQDKLLQAAQTLSQTMEATGYPPEYVEVGQVANLSYSLAEAFEGLARALATYYETDSLPANVETHDLLGPTVVFHSDVTPASMPADDVLDAAVAISAAITDRLPSQVSVGGQTLNTAEFLYLMAQEYTAITQGAPGPISLSSISALPLTVIQNHKADPLTKLQFWTYKPAVFDACC